MFDMWNSVTSKLEAHANTLGQTNVQSPGQNNSSGSIKGMLFKYGHNLVNTRTFMYVTYAHIKYISDPTNKNSNPRNRYSTNRQLQTKMN